MSPARVPPADWAEFQGYAAAWCGCGCPHAPGSALALIWRHGRALKGGDETVPRETQSAAPRPAPGRGHGRLGPRSEWAPAELEVLALTRHWPPAKVARVLRRRTAQAVANQRLRRPEGAAA
jgi:hypothetical protein